jgi:hypothetical protein
MDGTYKKRVGREGHDWVGGEGELSPAAVGSWAGGIIEKERVGPRGG